MIKELNGFRITYGYARLAAILSGGVSVFEEHPAGIFARFLKMPRAKKFLPPEQKYSVSEGTLTRSVVSVDEERICMARERKTSYDSNMSEYATNPKAGFDYEILETIEAGIVLEGHEVKAIKTGKASIKGSYVKILNNETYLVGATISPYQSANTPKNYDSQRSRKLLLSKGEISKLTGSAQAERTTLIPLKLYDNKGLIKLLVGVARGKKKYDKRETIKKKDVARAKQRGID